MYSLLISPDPDIYTIIDFTTGCWANPGEDASNWYNSIADAITAAKTLPMDWADDGQDGPQMADFETPEAYCVALTADPHYINASVILSFDNLENFSVDYPEHLL